MSFYKKQDCAISQISITDVEIFDASSPSIVIFVAFGPSVAAFDI